MEVLAALAQRPGEVVEREELLQRIWGNRAAVADEPLTRCIAELRRVLGDSRQTPTFIQTIPKRGYRLVCPVTPLAAPPAPPALHGQPAAEARSGSVHAIAAPRSRAGARRTSRSARPGLRGDARARRYCGVGHEPRRHPRATRPSDRNTIAVLPFIDVGGSPDDAYFGEGLADEILNRLSAVEGLRVVARTSSFAVRASTDDVRSIAQRLTVAHVLEGTVRRDGDRVRIDVQLVDARAATASGARLRRRAWRHFRAARRDREHDRGQAARHRPDRAADEPIATSAPTQNLGAYELLLRGRQYLHRRDEASLRRSIQLFEQAIALDARYGQAYVELAKAYALLPSYSTEIQDEMFDLALATLAKGVEQDASLDASIQVVLALVAYNRWDWITAEVAFRRALEHAHNDSDLLVWYSQFLSAVGRPLEGAEYARRAKELDVLSPVVNHRLSVASMWIDADDEAVRYADIAEELGMGPTPDAYIVLKFRQHDYAAVRPLLIGVQTMFARPTAWVDPLLDALAHPEKRPQAVEALARAEDARDVPPKYLFGAWLYLEEAERAIDAGLRLVNDRPSFNVEFVFSREARALRQHPRFGELVRAIGLNRYWDRFGWPDMCRKSGETISCD